MHNTTYCFFIGNPNFFLNIQIGFQMLPNRWTGVYGIVPWPVRSPDSTPYVFLHFFFFFMVTFKNSELPFVFTRQTSVLTKKNASKASTNVFIENQIKTLTSTEYRESLNYV